MPLDDNSQYANPIPAAIRRQSERVDEIAREMGIAGAPPVEGEGGGDHPGPELPPSAESTTVVRPEPAPQLEPPPVEDWEQRYRTLQGKYDAEVPGLRSQVSNLQGQVSSFQNLIATMERPAPTPEPAPTATPAEIPEADVTEWGEPLIRAAQRWAWSKVQPEIDALKAELNTLKSGQQRVEGLTAQQRVLNGLDSDPALAGRWREINETPEFIAWLNQVDPFSGQVRKALLSEAYGRGDVVRSGAFFKAYMNEHTAVNPAPTPAPHTPAPADTGRPTLESLAAPGRASGSAPVGAPEKRLWTRNQIAAFYRDVQRGVYNGREAERLRTEQDIIAAPGEGRIRN